MSPTDPTRPHPRHHDDDTGQAESGQADTDAGHAGAGHTEPIHNWWTDLSGDDTADDADARTAAGEPEAQWGDDSAEYGDSNFGSGDGGEDTDEQVGLYDADDAGRYEYTSAPMYGFNVDFRALLMGIAVMGIFWGLAIATYVVVRGVMVSQTISHIAPIQEAIRGIDVTAGGGLVLFSAFGLELEGGLVGSGALSAVDVGGFAALPPSTFLPVVAASVFLSLHIIQGRHPAQTWGEIISRIAAFCAGSAVVLYFAARLTTTEQVVESPVSPFALWFDLRIMPSVLVAVSLLAVGALLYFLWIGEPGKYSPVRGLRPIALRAHVHAGFIFSLVAGAGAVVVLAASSLSAEGVAGYMLTGFTLSMVLPAVAFGVPLSLEASGVELESMNLFTSGQPLLLLLVAGGVVLGALQFVFSAKRPCRFIPDVTIGAAAGFVVGYGVFTLSEGAFAFSGSGIRLAQMFTSGFPDALVFGADRLLGALVCAAVGALIPALACVFAMMLGRTERHAVKVHH